MEMGMKPGCYWHIPTNFDSVCPTPPDLGSAQEDGKSHRHDCEIVD